MLRSNLITRILASAFVLSGLALLALAQAADDDGSTLTNEKIFSGSDFEAAAPGTIQWLTAENAYTVLEPSDGHENPGEDDAPTPHDIVAYDLDNHALRWYLLKTVLSKHVNYLHLDTCFARGFRARNLITLYSGGQQSGPAVQNGLPLSHIEGETMSQVAIVLIVIY